eukprot:3870364-Amphidinium_carterae.1
MHKDPSFKVRMNEQALLTYPRYSTNYFDTVITMKLQGLAGWVCVASMFVSDGSMHWRCALAAPTRQNPQIPRVEVDRAPTGSIVQVSFLLASH